MTAHHRPHLDPYQESSTASSGDLVELTRLSQVVPASRLNDSSSNRPVRGVKWARVLGRRIG
jgi:hypothetical protein